MTVPNSKSDTPKRAELHIQLKWLVKFAEEKKGGSVESHIARILAWHEQEIAEARIDEWDYIHETLHEAHMNAVSYSTEVMQDRIAELSQTLKEHESS